MAAAALVQTAHTAFAAEALERVEVTGSTIKRVNAETASPLEVTSTKQMEATGPKLLQQILANMPAKQPQPAGDSILCNSVALTTINTNQ